MAATEVTGVKTPRRRVDWTEEEFFKVQSRILEIREEMHKGVRSPLSKESSWKEAQKVLPENRWRSFAPASIYAAEGYLKDALKAGKFPGFQLEPHDHRPIEKRAVVKVAPPAPTPAPTPSPAFSVPADTLARPVPDTISSPSVVDPVQMIAIGLSALVKQVIRDEVRPLLLELTSAISTKLDDQYLRQLEYWDPEAAKQVREGTVKIPPLKVSALETVVSPPAPTPPPTPAPTAPPKKHKVLIVGGKEDGFWSYLQDAMPECIITYADGHKPRSIPTGREFDFVLVHWMTSHSARAVIKNYYPDHKYMDKGSSSKVMEIIRTKFGIKAPVRKTS